MRRCWFAHDDLPINILARLGAKTLHSLKWVSKEWYNLISDTSFIRLQLKCKEPTEGFFFQEIFQWSDKNDKESVSYIPLETVRLSVSSAVLKFLPENVVILSSSNGLLCCRSCFPTSKPTIYICNPLNKQWTSLQWRDLSKTSKVALSFNPPQNSVNSTLINFKLVAVNQIEVEEYEYCFFFYIFSSEMGFWRKLNESCLCNNKIKNEGVVVNGITYWLLDGYKILMFDLQSEMPWLVTLPLPASQFHSIPEMCIGDSEDKLYYVIVSEYGLQLWVLEDHFASQWGLQACISLEELEKGNLVFLYDMSQKVANRKCKDLLAWIDPLAFKDGMLLMRVHTDMCLYQFETNRVKKLCDVSTLGPKAVFSPIALPYSMSLVPLCQA